MPRLYSEIFALIVGCQMELEVGRYFERVNDTGT